MLNANQAANRPILSDRRQLACSAALAAVLVLASQGRAHADEACGAPQEGVVVCAPGETPYVDGVDYAIDPETPQDLTVRLEDGVVVETDGIGVSVVNLNGSAAIDGAGAVVFTSGLEAAGVTAVSNGGGVRIALQSVQTSGAFSGGVSASARGGDVDIAVGQIVTEGDYSAAVSASNVDDDIRIEVGYVQTTGLLSDGITAETASGDIQIHADRLDTLGTASAGVRTVSTSGSTDIEVQSILTGYDYSAGVQAVSLSGDIGVVVGTVETGGAESAGVFVGSETGTVSARADQILTSGANSVGMAVYSVMGEASVDVGSIETRRDASGGLFVAGGSGAEATVGKVVTSGANAIGVQVVAGLKDPDYPLQLAKANVRIGSVETRGFASDAASVVAYGDIALLVDSARTLGDLSFGVTSFSDNGDSLVRVGRSETSGYGAMAVTAGSIFGDVDVAVREAFTAGDSASAIYGVSTYGDLKIALLETAATRGASSHGILATGVLGAVDIINAGSITTQGAGSSGILAASRGTLAIESNVIRTQGAGAVGIDGVTAQVADRAISVKAGSVQTAGDGAHGIRLANTDDLIVISAEGDAADYGITVEVGEVKTLGEEADAIVVNGQGDVTVRAGSVSSAKGTALNLRGVGLIDVDLRGAVSSGGLNAARLVGEDVQVTIAAGASLTGASNALVISASAPGAGPGGPVISPFEVGDGRGEAKVENAGRIIAGEGAAILLENGALDLVNTGVIEGEIALVGGDDRVDNRGSWSFDRDVEFGFGDDELVNSGLVRLAPEAEAATSAHLYGLERFVNDGGLVDLRNGIAGDVLTTDGDYEGRGDAHVALDLGVSTADSFVVRGAATGRTGLALQGVGKTAQLGEGDGRILVRMGEGSAADAFFVANADQGFVHYGLAYDAADREYALVSRAGSAVHRAARLSGLVQDASREADDAWSAHRAALRAAGHGARPGQAWAQAYGSRYETDDAVAGPDGSRIDLGYEAETLGGQSGVTLASRPAAGGTVVAGVTAGYAQVQADFNGAAHEAEVRTLNLGGYATYDRGRLFAGALAKYDWHAIDVDDAAAGYGDRIDGRSLGLHADAGLRFGESLVFEPSIALDYVSTSLDDLAALEQTVEFGDLDQFRGAVGVRVFGRRDLDDGRAVVISGGLKAVHAFEADQTATLVSGGIRETVGVGDAVTWGESELGVTLTTGSGLAAYVEGIAAFGDGRTGGGLRIGARFAF